MMREEVDFVGEELILQTEMYCLKEPLLCKNRANVGEEEREAAGSEKVAEIAKVLRWGNNGHL